MKTIVRLIAWAAAMVAWAYATGIPDRLVIAPCGWCGGDHFSDLRFPSGPSDWLFIAAVVLIPVAAIRRASRRRR